MSWVTIAVYDNPLLAHIARGSLEASGIPCFLADEHIVSTNWLVSIAVGGVKLQVPQEWRQVGTEILQGTSRNNQGRDGDPHTVCRKGRGDDNDTNRLAGPCCCASCS